MSTDVLNNVIKLNNLPFQIGNSGNYISNDGTDTTDMLWLPIYEYPLQTGLAGNYLTTDGTNTSWNTFIPNQTSQSTKFISTNGTDTLWDNLIPLQSGHTDKYIRTDGDNNTLVYWYTLIELPDQSGKLGMELSTHGVNEDSEFWSPFRNNITNFSANYTLISGNNASIVNPTINDGITITVPDGANLTIL